MWTTIRIPGYDYDTRGNRLSLAQIRALPSRPGRNRLYLKASDRIATQVEDALAASRPQALELREQDLDQDWTHRWEFEGTLPTEVSELINLLKEVLTLECSTELDVALALDFYKDPEEDGDGNVTWHDTESGRLVYRAKYSGSAVAREAAWNRMADRLAGVIQRHALLRRADAVVSVPGHVTTEWRPGERVASRMARLVDIPFLRTSALHKVRPEAKAATQDEQPFDLSEEFQVALQPRHRTILIVDDVVKSGRSMAAVAAAARRAGAATVYGLACARTRRKH
jgi:predicted amidophosphoribosyltransferase